MLSFFKNVNKWFYAFLGVTVALIAAVVVAIVLGLGANTDTPPVTQPSEGPETGIYYYDLEMGELQLTLNSGNQFSLAGPGYNTSGEYTINGNDITLDFVKDEDGTATAVLDGDTLQLTIGESVMTFLKKVNYVVSYNTNGGGVIKDAYVVNGKLAVKPADPVKEGFVFLGWYADEGLKTPFDFIATIIKADTMIYARWVEKSANAVEYTASFELGYDGAQTLPQVSTIGGKLYNLETPTREGYNFEGWFISTYDDGAKLTYEYTEDLALTEDTTLYAVWSQAGTDKLPAPKVSITGNSIKWNAVVGAASYKLKLTYPDGTVHEESLGATTKNVNFSDMAPGDVIVEVTAIANKAENSSDAATRYFCNKALDRVSTFTVIDGILVFNAVRNAEKYLITIECGNPGHNHTLYDNGKSTNFNFTNCTMQKGGIKFTVTAVAEGYANSVSKTFVYERALDAVSNLVYNKAEDTFTWDPVPFATYYTVIITTGGESYTFNKVMEYTFALGAYSGEISVQVIPVTEGYLSPEATTITCTKTMPSIPKNLVTNGMLLTWDANGAASYEVKINDKTFTVTEASFDLSNATDLSLNVGELYDISVRAIKDGEASAYSAPVKIGYYKLVPTLTYDNHTVYWSPVLGCSKFEVRVNGENTITVTGANSAKVTLTKTGLNVIEVRCTDLENAEWVSMQVNAYAVTYMSRTSLGEITEYLAVSDTMSLPRDLTQDGFTFDGWYNVPDGAEGNGKEYTESVFEGNNSMVLFANWKANEYKIIFQVDTDIVTNIENASTQTVVFNKPFTLPVPEISNNQSGIFKGWYTEAYGKGTKITNEEGVALAPFTHVGDLNVYAFIDTASDILTYELLPDNTYTVTGGPKVNSVTKIRIPATYQGVAITEISENAFLGCSNLKSISMPDTIRHIGVGAFDNCSKLEAFDVYVANEGTYEVYYGSADGALLFFDKASGNNYLEIFPRAKTGTYTVSDRVDTIRPYAFNNSNITKVIISTSITQISENAFYDCSRLETIEFAGNREKNVTIHNNAFSGLSNVTMIKLPALITPFDSNMTCLRSLTALNTILVEEGSKVYTAVENFLCDANPAGVTILYIPQTIRGEFKAPQGVIGIGANVFKANSAITSVVIPTYIESIGASAFANCTNLTNFTVEGPRNAALSIGSSAFSGCTGLTMVEFLGSNAKARGEITIGDSAFAGCTKLTTVKIGAGVNVAAIGNNAFKNNSKLTTIDVDDTATLTAIGNNAFEKCTSLESFTVHKTTTQIGNSAFKNCSALTTFIFGESEKSVSFGTSVFSGCQVLRTIRLPKTLTAFDGSVFNDCISLQSIEVDPANPNLQSKDGVLFTKGLTEILFYPKSLTTSLDNLPWDTLTKIGASVFKNNQTITSIKLGANITEIGEGAFYGCTKLASVSFDQNNKNAVTIGNQAFYGCTKLTSASVPMTTTSIGDEAFYNTQISSFTLPTSLTTIGTKTFAKTSLTSVNIPATVTSIGNGAFAGSKLTSVTFNTGSSPLTIGTKTAISGEGAFEGTSLTSVTLPKNLTTIGAFAFANIKGITTVTVPADSALAEIGASAFTGCSKLTTFNFNNTKISVIGASAFEGTAFTSLSLPGTLTYLGNNAFKSAPLTSVTLANGPAGAALEIGEGAFANSQFATITLPSHLNMLGAWNETYGYYTIDTVFAGNNNLHTINVDAANNIYSALDGILYIASSGNKDSKMLVYCPRAKTGSVTIPTSVYMVTAKAFVDTSLTEIIFAEFDKTDANYGQPLLTIGSFNAGASTSGGAYATIGESSPSGVSPLRYIKLPSHLDVVGSYAFYQIQKDNPRTGPQPDAELIIEFNTDSANGVVFYSNAISNNSGLKSLSLPPVKEMGTRAFCGNDNMTSLSLPTNSPATRIASFAFSSSKITSFIVPDNVTMIDDSAFAYCRELSTIDWGNSKVQTLGAQVFQNCKFTSFKIPDTVEYVGSKLLDLNSNLTSLELSAGMVSPVISSTESVLSGLTALQTLTLPDNHPTMQLIDGILYSKDGKTVYYCPASKKIEGALQLPAGIETIEAGAFDHFQGKFIIFPNTLKTINYRAFYYAQLEQVIFPASLETIAREAFSYTSKLSTIAFEGNSKLKTIDYQAFYSSGITSLSIPQGVTTLGYQAFYGCRNMLSVNVPNSIQTFSDQVFVSCSVLENVVFAEGVTTIPARTFRQCYALKSITIPDSVKTIGDFAFTNCTGLESVYFSENSQLSSVGQKIFNGCTNLQTVRFGNKLSSLNTGMFTGCTNLTEVRLPNAMTSIPESLFANCANLTTINIPTSVTSIGNNAFQNCANLTEITISAKVRSIGSSAFAGCTNLQTVNFADGSAITSISASAFDGDTKLANINLPATVTTFGAYAFRNTAVSDISFKSVTSVGTEAFYGCTNLKNASFTSALKTIGARAFAGCTGLENITLTTGLQTIGEDAFANCVKVQSFNIPATVTSISGNPFSNCTGVTKFTVDPANKSFIYSNGALFDKTGYTLIYYSAANTAETYTLPDTVHEILAGAFAGSQLKTFEIPANSNITAIPANAFKDSKSLTSITIPATIVTIGDSAFENCSALASIHIPESVTTIGNSAFANCSALANVTLANRNTNFTSIGSHLFENCTSLTQVVPFNGYNKFSEAMYKNTGIVNAEVPAFITDLSAGRVFEDCASLKTISLPADVTNPKLGTYFFYNCAALENVTLPAGIQEIAAYAFMNCSALTSVTANGALVGVNNSGFENCGNLTAITMNQTPNMFGVGARAFANCVKFDAANILPLCNVIPDEAFLNCAATTAPFVSNIKFGEVGNHAFKGTGITEFTFNHIEYASDNAFVGLAENATVTLLDITETDARRRFPAALTNSTATFTFMAEAGNDPDPEQPTLELTEKEQEGIKKVVGEYGLSNEAMEVLVKSLLEFKQKGYLNNVTTAEPSKEEIEFIQNVVAKVVDPKDTKLQEQVLKAFTQKWSDYKKSLMPKIELSQEEEEGIKKVSAEYGLSNEAIEVLRTSLWQFKQLGYMNNVTTAEPSKEEIEFIQNVVAKIVDPKDTKLQEQVLKAFTQKWTDLKSKLAPKVELTKDEMAGIERLCEENKELMGMADRVKDAMLTYKKAGYLNNVTSTELSKDEIALIERFCSEMSLDPGKFLSLFQDKLIAYKKTLIPVAPPEPTVELTKDEMAGIERLCEENKELMGMADRVKDAMLTYKKAGYLNNVTSTELSKDEIALIERFCSEMSLDPGKFLSLFQDKLIAYKKTLIPVAPPEPTVELTNEEIKGIDALIAERGREIGDIGEAMKAALLEYKKMGYLDNVTSDAVTDDEIKMIQQFCKANVPEEYIEHYTKEFQARLQAYKKSLIPAAPEPTVELTNEEIKGIDALIAERGREIGDIGEAMKAALLEYKKMGYLDNVTSDAVTDAEIKMIQQFCKTNVPEEYVEHYTKEFQARLQAYKKSLIPAAPEPTVELTNEEIKGIDALIAERGREIGDIGEAMKAALLEYKKMGYLDNVTSDAVTDDEIKMIQQFCKTNVPEEYIEHYTKEFQARLQAYKKTIMVS